MRTFAQLFPRKYAIIGVLHLKGQGTQEIRERARREIDLYLSGGLDAIIAEDYFGAYPHLEWVLGYLQAQKLPIPYGLNCLNFDSMGFHLARQTGCDFLQLDSVVGHVKPRDEASLDAFFALERPRTGALVMGGVRFKYQPVLSEHTVEEDLTTAMGRCDCICVTGDGTGMQTPLEKLQQFRAGVGRFPLVICSGLTDENCDSQLPLADGAVVGSFFKDTGKDTGDVEPARIKRLMSRVRILREQAETR